MELKQGKVLKFNKPKTFFELSTTGELINIYAVKSYELLDKKLVIGIQEHTQQVVNIRDCDRHRLVKWLKSWGVDSPKKTIKKSNA